MANGYDDGFAVTGMPSSQMDVNQNYLTDVGAYTDSVSSQGTFDQAGNVWEWTEALSSLFPSKHILRGSCWGYDSFKAAASYRLYGDSSCGAGGPPAEGAIVGFRMARVPEPTTLVMLAAAGAGVIRRGRKSPGGAPS